MKHWQSALVFPKATLEEAIATMDRSALRIAIVVDTEQRLLGTLTDGDVRRALLSHKTLNVPVELVMCPTPKVAQRNWNRDRVLAVMESNDLLHMPVVDEQGHIVDLEIFHELVNKRLLSNTVFLMAGGFGTRLHPLTHDCPKPMLKVGGKPILELILEGFIRVGFNRFYISTHYLPEMVREHFGDGSRWGVTIDYVHEDSPLGTAGALGLLPHHEINAPMLVMNGDLMTTLDYRELLEFHIQNDCAATMCVREFEIQVPYGVIQSEGSFVKSIVEKPVQKLHVNAGIYVLSPELIRSVQSGKRIDMPALLECSIAEGNRVAMFPVHEYWLDIGRMEDFKRAQIEIETLAK